MRYKLIKTKYRKLLGGNDYGVIFYTDKIFTKYRIFDIKKNKYII
jgi:hypothetical protein